MATNEFITNANALIHLQEVKGAFNVSGTFNNDWFERELEAQRGHIWAGISEYAIYDSSGDLEYTEISDKPLSMSILESFMVDLMRCRAYLSVKGGKAPEPIQKRCDAVMKMLDEHSVQLPDLKKKAEVGSSGNGAVYVSKNTPKFDRDTVKDW